jgi:hypothetical protein
MQLSIFQPFTIDQPSICADGINIIIAALKQLQADGVLTTKPAIVTISTTGIGKTRDVPYLLVPLYHWVLAVPHKDKIEMEKTLAQASVEENSPLAGFASVRASLLTDGSLQGADKVRSGWERHPSAEAEPVGPGPAIGYTISRADVGNWIFEKIVKEKPENWAGKCFSITA